MVSIIVTEMRKMNQAKVKYSALPGSKVEPINLQAREGNGNDSLFLDLEADLGTGRDGFIECELDSKGDHLASSEHNREGFDSGDIY